MITELLGLGGIGISGAVFGLVSDWFHDSKALKLKELDLQIERERAQNGITSEHTKAFSREPQFGECVRYIVLTYCICCILCILFPTFPIHTFNPDDTPKRISFFEIISYEWQTTKIYIITTGGVGYALLHPLAFQIGTVITGIRAK